MCKVMSNLAVFCVVVFLFNCHHVIESSNNDSSNCCEFPEGMCLCYNELEKSLFSTDKNKIDLSTTFFPLEENQPEFVTVRYNFADSNVTQIWFWSAVTSHFLHPFEVFQFFSLFFGKPEPYFRGNLNITLNAECANLSSTDIKLQLLTQRLKYYAERGTSTPILRDAYSAKAYSEDSLKGVFQRNSERTTNIIICTAVFVVVLSFVIILCTFFQSYLTKTHNKSKMMEKLKTNSSVVISLAILSFIANIYITFLAGTALGFWRHRGEDELRRIFHNFDEKRNLGPLIFALIIDLFCLIAWVVITLISCYYYLDNHRVCESKCSEPCGHVKKKGTCHCKLCTPDQSGKCDHCTTCTKCCYDCIPILSLTVLCPVFCIIAHSPYIAIAYLDDGSHASSIFIYYSILGYVLFGLLWLFFHWYESFEKDLIRFELPPHVKDLRIITVAILILVILTFFGLVVTITCYFVLIPINKSISDAPNRIFSIYESGGFVVGSVIVYKVLEFFHNKKKKETTTEEKIHEILRERLPCPLQQQFHKLQQRFDQLQLELHLTPQNPEPQNQLEIKNLQKQCYEQQLQSLHQIEQRLLQSEQKQQQQQGQPQVDDNQTQQQTLRNLQHQLHDIQQKLYQVLFLPQQPQRTQRANDDQQNEENQQQPQQTQSASDDQQNEETPPVEQQAQRTQPANDNERSKNETENSFPAEEPPQPANQKENCA